MARLAAYYQEDFHYAPVGPKQRKTAYIVYDEPKNNLFNSGYGSGGTRIRALGASDPNISPTYSPKTAVMTLKAKPRPLNTKLLEQSRLAVQRLENLYEPAEVLNPYAVAEMFDRESLYAQSVQDDPYRHQSRDLVYKRTDPWDNRQHEVCQYQCPGDFRDRAFDTNVGESFPLIANCVDPHDQCFTPPVSFRSDSSHERWQQWPWNTPDTRVSPVILSPSPHDSGLSSQSITSSPSLDAEPLSLQSLHSGQIPSVMPDARHVCSCSPVVYAEPGRVRSPPSRYDSGRSSPGVYSVTMRSRKPHRRKRHEGVFLENGLEDEYARSQVRYGMLGILNEPVSPNQILPKTCNGQYAHPEIVHGSSGHATYYYVEKNAEPVKVPRASKLYKQQQQQKPSIVTIEPIEKDGSKSSSSPDQDVSGKSPDPESSASSQDLDPPSLDCSNNDAENEERRKLKKKTEKEIRELEDMYQKCNLGDQDLLERAERRDLPTQHQLKSRGGSTLTRSKSDTFYEMLSSAYHNPYELPVRAPPRRRAGIPDIVSDDMALRKLHKPVASANPVDNTMSYMLCSSHFTPAVSNVRDFLYSNCPDIEYDDLSYRKHYFGKKSKVLDPQPPFGIPLRPPPPQSVYNDYLHAIPNGGPQPLCHPRRNPDVVRDDMAYRTLRRDEAEAMYHEVCRKKKG